MTRHTESVTRHVESVTRHSESVTRHSESVTYHSKILTCDGGGEQSGSHEDVGNTSGVTTNKLAGAEEIILEYFLLTLVRRRALTHHLLVRLRLSEDQLHSGVNIKIVRVRDHLEHEFVLQEGHHCGV